MKHLHQLTDIAGNGKAHHDMLGFFHMRRTYAFKVDLTRTDQKVQSFLIWAVLSNSSANKVTIDETDKLIGSHLIQGPLTPHSAPLHCISLLRQADKLIKSDKSNFFRDKIFLSQRHKFQVSHLYYIISDLSSDKLIMLNLPITSVELYLVRILQTHFPYRKRRSLLRKKLGLLTCQGL